MTQKSATGVECIGLTGPGVQGRQLLVLDGPERVRELDDNIAEIERSVALVRTSTTSEDVHAAVRPFRTTARHPHI